MSKERMKRDNRGDNAGKCFFTSNLSTMLSRV